MGWTLVLIAWIGCMVWIFMRGQQPIDAREGRIVIWLLFAMFALATIANYDTGRDLRRVCRALASQKIGLEEVRTICADRLRDEQR